MSGWHDLGKLSEHDRVEFRDSTGARWVLEMTEEGVSVRAEPYSSALLHIHPTSHNAVTLVNPATRP